MDEDAGFVESGVIVSLLKLGIQEPVTHLECQAINLAQILDGLNKIYKDGDGPKARYDGGKDDKISSVASINRELRQTMADVANQPSPKPDAVQQIADRY